MAVLAENEVIGGRSAQEAFYWIGVFCSYGMALSQAEVLASGPCDRHAVRVALEQGCDPDWAFLIWS